MKTFSVVDFFGVLFDEGESTCFTSEVSGNKVYRVSSPPRASTFFSINPLDGKKDNCPKKPWHRVNVPRRDDGNIVVMRNFLVEIDKNPDKTAVPITEQIEIFKRSGLPWATVCFSGKKSLHGIISLEEHILETAKYKREFTRILNLVDKVAGRKVCDRSMGNPSRLSRFPEAMRADTGKRQTIKLIGKRCSKNQLGDLFDRFSVPEVTEKRPEIIVTIPAGLEAAYLEFVSPYIAGVLRRGVPVGASRHTTIFQCAGEMGSVGLGLDFVRAVIYEKVFSKCAGGLLTEAEFERTVVNGFVAGTSGSWEKVG